MDEARRAKHQRNVYTFHCKAIKPPPGTKAKQRLPRGLEEETPPRRLPLLISLVVLALAVGVAIGRFLLP